MSAPFLLLKRGGEKENSEVRFLVTTFGTRRGDLPDKEESFSRLAAPGWVISTVMIDFLP